MAQRVRIPHRGTSPSSVTQLPITDSTSREVSYSVAPIIHDKREKVNIFLRKTFENREFFCKKALDRRRNLC